MRAAPEPKPLPDARPAEITAKTFEAICRAEGRVESRRDPDWLRQSYVGDNCQAPRPPAAIDGFSASREEIVAGMAAVKRYTAAADAFQQCVSDFIAAHEAEALTPAQIIIQNYRVQVSQKNKEVATNQMHAAIMAFNSYGSECPMY